MRSYMCRPGAGGDSGPRRGPVVFADSQDLGHRSNAEENRLENQRVWFVKSSRSFLCSEYNVHVLDFRPAGSNPGLSL